MRIAFPFSALLSLAALPAQAHPSDTPHLELGSYGSQLDTFLAMGLPALLVGIAIYHYYKPASLSAGGKKRGEKN